MRFLYPTMVRQSVTDITLEDIEKLGVRGLLLDVDNTLTKPQSQHLDPKVKDWLDLMQKNNVKLTIVSNAMAKRVRPFAKKINMESVSFACKPLPFGFLKAVRTLNLSKKQCAVVGDQTFTDILGSKLGGIKSIQVLPIEPEDKVSAKFKRFLEGHILNRYHKKHKKSENKKK